MIPYIDSPTEADFICSYIVKNKIAFGCLSDDLYIENKAVKDFNLHLFNSSNKSS